MSSTMRCWLAVMLVSPRTRRAVVHACDQGGVGGGDGVDAAAGGENLGGELDGVAEVAGDFGECGDEEVAEVVALEAVAGAEAVAKSWASRSSSSLSATMQLRRSPGGSMLKSLRRRPEEPPSSVTVTRAARSVMRLGSESAETTLPGTATCLRRPRSRVDKPVPPPMATTRSGTGCVLKREVLKRRSFVGQKCRARPANWLRRLWIE